MNLYKDGKSEEGTTTIATTAIEWGSKQKTHASRFRLSISQREIFPHT